MVDANDANKSISKTDSNAKQLGTRLVSGIKTAAKWGAALAGAASTAFAAVSKLTIAAANHGDEVEKNSQKVGLSFEAYQQWDYVMTRCGTSIQDCTTGLKTLTNKLDDARHGSKGATETFNRLGISVDSLNGLSREQVFKKMVFALQNVKDETEKAALANDLFGKSGQNLMPMFNMTEAETKELLQNIKDLGGVMSDEAVKASAAFVDSMTDLKTAFGGFKNKLISDFLPSITKVMDGITAVLSGDREGGNEKIKSGLNEVTESFGKLLTDIKPILEDVWDAIVTTMFSEENISRMVQGAGALVYNFLEGLFGQSKDSKNQSKAAEIGQNIGRGIRDGIVQLIEDYNWFELIWDIIKGSFQLAFGGANTTPAQSGGMGIHGYDMPNRQHASGLTYVPYDGYAAMLHRGERIVSAGQVDHQDNALIEEIRGLRNDLSSYNIYLDGDALVGGMVDRLDNTLGRRATSAGRLSMA